VGSRTIVLVLLVVGCGGNVALVDASPQDAQTPDVHLELDAGDAGEVLDAHDAGGACRPKCCADLERYRCHEDPPDARPRSCSAVDVLPGPCDGWRCAVMNADGVLVVCP